MYHKMNSLDIFHIERRHIGFLQWLFVQSEYAVWYKG